MNKPRVACIQMASSPNVSANLLEAGKLIEQAVDEGARMIVLPENFALMGLHEQDKLGVAENEGQGPIQDFMQRIAHRHGIWLVGGTIPIRASEDKVMATCLIYDDKGECAGRYDKIHLFDVHVPGSDETYLESNTISAGTHPLVIQTPWGRLGVAICYDLRFPELFRRMAMSGMEMLAIPSAFTQRTGAAHWEVLLRARSIENQCYTLASNQGGYHINGRETYGHSLICEPWGQVIACIPGGSGHAIAELDMEKLQHIRTSFPVLQHCRLIQEPSV
ncbi:MAG: hypothetical protein RIQ52_488 [Pseudomonadota bacterium]|jgi:nitrilase